MWETIGGVITMVLAAAVGWVIKVERRLTAHDEALKTIQAVDKKVDKLDSRLEDITDYLLAKNGPR